MDIFQRSYPKICPFLGSRDDPEIPFSFATEANHCHQTDPAEPVSLAYQGTVCLTHKHRDCPVYGQAWEESLPPGVRRESVQEDESLALKPKVLWGSLGGIVLVCIAVILLFRSFGKNGDAIGEQTSIAGVLSTAGTPLPTHTHSQIPTQDVTDVPNPSPVPTQTASPVSSATEAVSPTSTSTQTPEATITPSAPTPGPALMTPFGEDNEYLLHQVKSGESMPMLAERYQTSLDVITAANGFYPGYGLQLDQVIVIMPGKIDSQDVKPFLVILLDQDISISDLSSQYVVIPEKIKEINDLGLGDIIPVGRWLILPRRQIVPTAPPQPTPTPDLSFALTEPFGPNDEYVIHRLNPGETYQILARLYLTSTDVIKAANVIEASLQVDQLLVIVRIPVDVDPDAQNHIFNPVIPM